jgi:hypothetical protein
MHVLHVFMSARQINFPIHFVSSPDLLVIIACQVVSDIIPVQLVWTYGLIKPTNKLFLSNKNEIATMRFYSF